MTAHAERVCGWTGLGVTPVCSAPATWHLRWKRNVSYACEEHAVLALPEVLVRRPDPAEDVTDAHPLCGDCGVPGAVWIYSEDEPPGRCRWDPEVTEERAVERELVSA
jgi:hypothetical protein